MTILSVYLIWDFSVSSHQQVTAPHIVLGVNPPLLRAFPWQTSVIFKLLSFLGNVGGDSLDVSLNLTCMHFPHL